MPCPDCFPEAYEAWTVDVPVPIVRGKTRPLTLNDRLHHIEKANIVSAIRRDAALAFRASGVPPLEWARVRLLVTPPDKRRRDTDNLVATFKPCVDGMRDAGVLWDDSPDAVELLMPSLLPPDGVWRLAVDVQGVRWRPEAA